MKVKRVIVTSALALVTLGTLTAGACSNDADVVNKNLDTAADNFQVLRRVTFYNAILDKTILEVEGYCSVDPGDGRRMSVVCKVGEQYKRNALGTSDNVLWFYEQLDPAGVSKDHYKFVIKPQAVIPNVEVR